MLQITNDAIRTLNVYTVLTVRRTYVQCIQYNTQYTQMTVDIFAKFGHLDFFHFFSLLFFRSSGCREPF